MIVVRPAAPFEILFVRRQLSMAFMGGAHVFPGGKVDAADREGAAQAGISPEARAWAARALEPPVGGEAEALGLYVAACRELLEETGVLLTEPAAPAGVAVELRSELGRGGHGLLPLLAARGLAPSVRGLHRFAHWITPSLEPRRFDTHFFVAEMPPAQEAVLDTRESSAFEWLAPAAALARHDRGELTLPPPTLHTVARLGRAESMPALWVLVRTTRVEPVLPKIVEVEGNWGVLLPWDREYAAAPGEGTEKPRHPLAAEVSRVVLEGGRFVAK